MGELCWSDFRNKVLGPTDPTAAPTETLRGYARANWKDLGLLVEPNLGDNCVHASASPFEGLAERINWLGYNIEEDVFGKGMLSSGITKDQINKWSSDSQVEVEGETAPGKTMSVFDTLEDLDADDSLKKVKKIK